MDCEQICKFVNICDRPEYRLLKRKAGCGGWAVTIDKSCLIPVKWANWVSWTTPSTESNRKQQSVTSLSSFSASDYDDHRHAHSWRFGGRLVSKDADQASWSSLSRNDSNSWAFVILWPEETQLTLVCQEETKPVVDWKNDEVYWIFILFPGFFLNFTWLFITGTM